MLPIMVFSLFFMSFNFLRFLKSLQNVVDEIWLDKSGNEVRMLYRNKSYRQFRGAITEEKFINSALVSPAGKSEALTGK
jgi:hypothetical protein